MHTHTYEFIIILHSVLIIVFWKFLLIFFLSTFSNSRWSNRHNSPLRDSSSIAFMVEVCFIKSIMVWSFNLQAFFSFCLNCLHPPTYRARNRQTNRNNADPNRNVIILTNSVACTSYTSVPQSSPADNSTEDSEIFINQPQCVDTW